MLQRGHPGGQEEMRSEAHNEMLYPNVCECHRDECYPFQGNPNSAVSFSTLICEQTMCCMLCTMVVQLVASPESSPWSKAVSSLFTSQGPGQKDFPEEDRCKPCISRLMSPLLCLMKEHCVFMAMCDRLVRKYMFSKYLLPWASSWCTQTMLVRERLFITSLCW